ncbi:hypothetical protein EsH8_VIII_000956 [Colletotrichum jinshuiense]
MAGVSFHWHVDSLERTTSEPPLTVFRKHPYDVYASTNDLSRKQMRDCEDIWFKMADMLPESDLTDGDIDKLWDFVFAEGWTSRSPDVPLMVPELPARDVRYLRAASLTVRRLEEDPNAPGLQRWTETKEPVHLKVEVSIDTCVWYQYVSRSSSFLQLEDPRLQFDQGFDHVSASERAVIHRDKWKKEFYTKYNVRHAVYLARRRLHSWARRGYTPQLEDDYTRLGGFVRIKLALNTLEKASCRNTGKSIREQMTIAEQLALRNWALENMELDLTFKEKRRWSLPDPALDSYQSS